MNRTYWIAAGLIGLTALISPGLWLADFPPEWATDKGETVAMIRRALTTPFVLAGVAALLTLPVALARRKRLTAPGKSRNIAIAYVLAIPIAFLSLQILMPLMLYDVITKDSAQFFFLGFMAVFFLVMGNYIVTAPYRSPMGFRTAATLKDEATWTKTHRFLGRNLVLVTLAAAPAGLLLAGPKPAQWILIGSIAMLKLATYFYARQLAARHALRNAETELVH